MLLSESIISRLRSQHTTIAELICGISEDRLKLRPDLTKWSIFENIAHLACYQHVFLDRIRKIREIPSPSSGHPSFERYVAEQDTSFPPYLEKRLPWLLADIDELRDLIRRELSGASENELELIGVHPRFGWLTLRSWTEFFLLHEAHHLYTIFRLVPDLRNDSAISNPGER